MSLPNVPSRPDPTTPAELPSNDDSVADLIAMFDHLEGTEEPADEESVPPLHEAPNWMADEDQADPSPAVPNPGERVDLPPPPATEEVAEVASRTKLFTFRGLHGGAGVSTLVAAVPAGAEEHIEGRPYVLVCRSTWTGLVTARKWAGEMHDRTGLLGLVVVADLPKARLPKRMADQLVILQGGYPHVWQVPFVRAWRTGDGDPSPDTAPRQYEALAVDLAAKAAVDELTDSSSEPPPNPSTER